MVFFLSYIAWFDLVNKAIVVGMSEPFIHTRMRAKGRNDSATCLEDFTNQGCLLDTICSC